MKVKKNQTKAKILMMFSFNGHILYSVILFQVYYFTHFSVKYTFLLLGPLNMTKHEDLTMTKISIFGSKRPLRAGLGSLSLIFEFYLVKKESLKFKVILIFR